VPLVLLLLVVSPAAAFPQTAAPAAPAVVRIAVNDTVQVVAGANYAAGAVHRWFFGAGWRRLWTAPVRVPRLDLRRTAGGLWPVERGGGFQTRSLELASGDGREFRFRSVNKDPSQKLPGSIRWPGIIRVVRDQTSALHPGGALVAASLAEAAGVAHVFPTMVVMPDDPSLGPYRAEFGGMLGLLEERPTPGAAGAGGYGFQDVVETDSLLPRLAGGQSRVDQREYLAARLLDLLINDWDRHEGNWLWGTPDSARPFRWRPIAKDRDQAFASYEGLALGLVRLFVPKLVPFTGEYRLRGLTANAETLDARFLRDLAPAVWDSVATALVARLDDATIEKALRAMPEPYYRMSRGELRARLVERRARLPAATREWAERLTGKE
jgi:hypothetical protein